MKMRSVDTTQTQSAKINWGQILGKGASGAKTLFEPIMPSTVNTLSSTGTVVKDIRNATRALNSTTKRQDSQMKNSTANKKSQSLFKSAFSDIEAGSFSMDKINNDLFDDYESQSARSFDMPSGDDAAEMSSEEILLLGNKGVAQSIIQSSSAQLRGLEASSKALINANIKSTQALGISINNTLVHGFHNINATLTIQNQKLDTINRGISGLLEFNNTNAIEYYTKSIDMMAGIGKVMDNFEKSMNPQSRKKNRVFDTSYGFNPKEYFEYIKEGFKESLFGTGTQMVGSAVKDKDFGLMGILIDTIVPKAIKDPLSKFDKSFIKMMDEGFRVLGDKINQVDIFQMLGLGDIFGSKREKINSVNLGKYMKEATPWNGMAQKALVEVIPELLTSIDSKLDNSEKRYYDYDSGQFITESKLKQDYLEDYFSNFSMSLRDSFDKLTEAAKSTGRQDTNTLVKAIEALIDDRITGKKDSITANRDIEYEMRRYGINKTQIRQFLDEFTYGYNQGVMRNNDMSHEIGTTQHKYRNLFSQSGKEYSKDIKDMHKNRQTSGRYTTLFTFDDDEYSFRTKNISEIIQEIQAKHRFKNDVSGDRELQDDIANMIRRKAPESDIVAAVRRKSVEEAVSSEAKSKFSKSKLYQKTKASVETIGSKIDEFGNSILDTAGRYVYTDNPITDIPDRIGQRTRGYIIANKFRHPKYRNAASTLKTKKDGEIPSQVQRAVDQIDAIREDDYDISMKKSQSELERENIIINKSIDTITGDKTNPETVEGSIIKSNNMLQASLGAILNGFKGFTSRLFGKEGFFKKLWDSDTRKKITGKLFTDENAIFKKQYDGAKAGLKSLKDKTVDYLGKGYDFLYDNTMKYKYGEDYKNSEKYKSNKFVSETLNRNKPTDIIKDSVTSAADAVQESAENLEDSMDALVEVTVGDPEKSPAEKKRAFSNDFIKRLKETAPKALAGAIAGAGVGLLNNQFSLLGSMFLPGGPIGGAIVGGGLTILSQTEAFKSFMFGKLSDPNDPNSVREGGLISKELRGKFTKMLPFAIGGAVTGALSATIKGALGFNSGLGVLGMQILPGGILGGAILGAGLGILKNSDKFKEMLFGKKDADGKHQGKFLSNMANKSKDLFTAMVPGFKKAATGLGVGALTGAVLSNAGYIPAMLSMGGPVGMGIVGLGLGIASSTDRFNEWMFGTKDPDTGERRKDGILSRSVNMLRLNVIEPIGDAFKTNMLDLVDWTRDKITYPFRLAFGPIIDSLTGIKDNVVDFVKDKFDALGNGIMEMMSKTMKSLFSPVTKLIGFVGKSIMGIAGTGTKIALSPLSVGLQAMQFLTMGKRRKEYIKFAKEYYTGGGMTGALNEKWDNDAKEGRNRNFFGKMSDTVGAFLGQGEASAIAKNKYADKRTAEGDNTLDWMRVSFIGNERREQRKATRQRKEDEKRWVAINKERKKIMTELGGREVTLTDEAVNKYQKRFGKLGISKDHLQNSNDIMDLIYRRDEFKQRMSPTNESGSVFEETPAQKEARENTEKFRNNITTSLNQLLSVFGVDKPGTETVAETLNDIKQSAEETAATSNLQAEITTGGEANETIKPKRGQNLKASLVNKYNVVASFLGFKKKQEEIEKEASEDEESQAGHGRVEGKTAIKKGDEPKEQSAISKFFGKLKSIGAFIGGSTIGSFLLKGVKFAGTVGLLGGLGFTIAELIRPGTAEKVGAKIDAFNTKVANGEFTFDTVIDDVKQSMGKFGTIILDGAKNIFGKENIDAVKTFILEVIPEYAKSTGDFLKENSDKVITAFSSVIENLAPPLISALVQTIPTIAWAAIKGIASGTVKILGSGVDAILDKLGFGTAKTKTVSESTAVSDFENKGVRSKAIAATTKSATSEFQALSRLDSNDASIRNTVIQNAATGQYYIYDDTTQTQKRNYLEDEAAIMMMEDPEMAPNIWYDPNTNAYFVEEATYEQYADNVYITASGDLKKQGHTDITRSIGKNAIRMSTRIANGLSAFSKADKFVLKGVAVAGKAAGTVMSKVGSVVSKFGTIGKIIGGSTKATGDVASAVSDTATKQMPKLLEKMRKMLSGIKGNKTLLKVFDKFKKVLTVTGDDILESLVMYLDDIAVKNFGKASGKVAEKISATVSLKIGKSAVTSFPLITIVSAAWGLVDGALSAANLFEVAESDVDWKMVLISSLMEALLSISVGCWIDLLFDVVDFTSGLDLKHEIAIFLYKLISGYDADAIEKLSTSSENLALETSVYNALNDTNLSTKSYNDKQNKDLLGKIGAGLKSFGNWITGNSDKNYVDSGKAYSDYSKILREAGYTDTEISKMSKDQITTAVRQNVDSSSLSANNKQKVISSLGYGLGYSVRSNNPYAQGNPQWANMPIGRLPNGSIATMSNAGCGPTALAAVANTVAQRSVGYGPITPADMAAYATSNGYISQGGANAGLFTEGANKLGLNSSSIKNTGDLINNLLAGRPAILTGKSSNSNDPYTKAGHIVVADGMVGTKMSIIDPINGKHKLYNMKDVSKKTEHAWAYSAGYGPSTLRVDDDGGSSTSRSSFGSSRTGGGFTATAVSGAAGGAASNKKTSFGTSTTNAFSSSGGRDTSVNSFTNTRTGTGFNNNTSTTKTGITATAVSGAASGATTTKRTSFGSSTSGDFTTGGGRSSNTTSTRTDFGTSTSGEFTNGGGRDTDTSESSSTETTSTSTSTGITNLEQLSEYAATKGIFGKISLMGKVLQARINAMLYDSDFWTEFEKLTSKANNASEITITGSSTKLQDITNQPNNIKEELLAKTIERVYIAESGGNYAAVINDTNNKASVGPYQANGANAVQLLNDLSNTSGLSYDLKNIFTKYSRHIAAGKSLSNDQKKELSNALANTEYKDTIMQAIDKNAMNYYYTKFYKPYAVRYYDSGIIKDLRTLPMLADIGNTGYDFITNGSMTRKNSFMYNWTPVNKDEEFDTAYNLLTSSKLYYKNSKHGKSYLNRITNTYNALKNYKFKNSVAQGEMRTAFASPVGFGPLDDASGFSNTLNSISNSMIDQFGKLTGIDPALLGLVDNTSADTSATNDSSVNNTTSNSNQYTYNGSYDDGYRLTSVSGTDRDRFIAAAKSQVGYYEKKDGSDLISFAGNRGNNHYTKYAKEIGGWNGVLNGKWPAHWCNFFTSWAGKAAGIPSSIVNRSGSCSTTRDFYKNKSLYFSSDDYSGKPGDLVFFNWSGNKNSPQHIGIVSGTDSNNVYTIEGNTSNGTGIDAVASKTRSRSSGTIIGFATPPWTNEYKDVNPSTLLSLGYGNPNLTKIDSPAYREQMRESIKDSEEFNITHKDLQAIGFGPGMAVDAGFDMTNTDSKLDKIFSVIAEWYTESKKTGAAQSSATNNINMIKANTTNVSSKNTSTPTVNVQKYKESIVNNHVILASKANIRNNM